VIDSWSLDLDTVIREADMIVVGAPPIATGELLAELLPRLKHMSQQPIITDLASIKGWVIERAGSNYVGYVPGHPIAGSEDSGVGAAKADLFVGREIILTPTEHTNPSATAEVSAMWQLTGARVSCLSVADHDAALAASSHSPHMVAYALTMALADHPLSPFQHGGGALRDMTRIAGSDPIMWRDIAMTNRDALLLALDDVEGELMRLRALVEAADGAAMEQYFQRCREVRRANDAVLNPIAEASAYSETGSRPVVAKETSRK
jgi:prephenate dehydrogenase